jgi:hypothetical protein
MSYPATLSTLSLLAPVTPATLPSPSTPSTPSTSKYRRRAQLSDLQLLPWLRLAARQLLRPELQERIEPYRPCVRCVRQARWCGEGCRPSGSSVRLLQDLNPLTPSVVIGARAEPYPVGESLQRRTRELLAALDALHFSRGLEISIFTRSPLILRDLDLLADLDQRHVVTVGVLIPAAAPNSPVLASRVEGRVGLAPGDPRDPRAPLKYRRNPGNPDARFELVRTLAAHGIAAEVVCTPIVPGLNNGAADLERLFDRAWQASAADVRPAPRHPALPPTASESRHLLALFHRLRLERGFPRTVPARG